MPRLSSGLPVGGANYRASALGAGGYFPQIRLSPTGQKLGRTDVGGAYKWDAIKDKWVQLYNTAAFTAPYNSVDFFWEGTGNYWSGGGCFEVDSAPGDDNFIVMEVGGGYLFKSTNGGTHFDIVTGWTRKQMRGGSGGDRLIGPKFAIDSDKLTWHICTETQVWRTIDGGTGFTHIASIPDATGDPANSGADPCVLVLIDQTSALIGGRHSIVFVYSSGNGWYRSNDCGATYTQIVSGAGGRVATCMKIDSAGTAYACSQVYGGGTPVINRCTSAGVVSTLSGMTVSTPDKVAILPSDPNTIVVMNGAGDCQASTDHAVTWSAAVNYLGWQPKVTGDVPWIARNSNFQIFLGISDLRFDPVVPGRVWAAHGIGVFAMDNFVANILAGTLPWVTTSRGIEELVATECVSIPGGPMVHLSQDRGAFFSFNLDTLKSRYVDDGFQQSFGWDADWARDDPNFVAVLVSGGWQGNHAVGYSLSKGADGTYQNFPTQPNDSIGGSLAVSTSNNICVFAGLNYKPRFTLDRGVTWGDCIFPAGVPTTGALGWNSGWLANRHVITADKARGDGIFYAFNSGDFSGSPAYSGIYESTDGGQHFVKVSESPSNPLYTAFNVTLRAVPYQAGHAFFSAGPNGVNNVDLMRTTDSCRTWTKVLGHLSDGTVITSIVGAYVSFGAPLTPGGYVTIFIQATINGVLGNYRSDDGGSTWRKMPAITILDEERCIAGDLNKYGRFIIGLAGNGYQQGNYFHRVVGS